MRIRILAAVVVLCGTAALAYVFGWQNHTDAARGVEVETECGVRVLGECAVTSAPAVPPFLPTADGKAVSYEGDHRDGKRHGFGRVTWEDGNTYAGEWRDDAPHGRGRFTMPNGSYHEGEWRNGKANGLGMAVWHNGARYYGEWRDGRLDGRGTLTFANGNRYEGEWQATRMTGQGRGTWTDGSSYEGAWQRDWPHGTGTYTANGVSHAGTWNTGCLKAADGTVVAIVKSHQECHFLLERVLVSAR